MAKLIVSDGASFDPGLFQSSIGDFDGATTLKADDDLWRVDFGTNGEDGQAYVRGSNFEYDPGSSGVGDDVLTSGDITSLSFNAPDEVGGQAFVRVRGLDNLSGEKLHDAIFGTEEDAFNLLRSAFKGDDVLKGAGGADYLLGFKGEDTIKAGGGEDFIAGGKGEDRLHGGDDADRDVFSFANGDSGKNADHADRIYDFTSDLDLIDLTQTGGNKSLVHIDHSGGNSTITVDAHDDVDKLVIVVADNDSVHKSDLTFHLVM